jgi:hypothetical protein
MPPKGNKKIKLVEEDLSIEERERLEKIEQKSKEQEKGEKEKEGKEVSQILVRSSSFFNEFRLVKQRMQTIFDSYPRMIREFNELSAKEPETARELFNKEEEEEVKLKFEKLQDAFFTHFEDKDSRLNMDKGVLINTVDDLKKKKIKPGIVKLAQDLLQRLEEFIKMCENELNEFERVGVTGLKSKIQTLQEARKRQIEKERLKEKELEKLEIVERKKKAPLEKQSLSKFGLHVKEAPWISSTSSFPLERFERPKIFISAINEPAKLFLEEEKTEKIVHEGVEYFSPDMSFYEDFFRLTHMASDEIVQQADKQFIVIYVNRKGDVKRHDRETNFFKNVNCLSIIPNDELKEDFVKKLSLQTQHVLNIIQNYIVEYFLLPLHVVQEMISVASSRVVTTSQQPMFDFISYLAKFFLTFLSVLGRETNFKRQLVKEFAPELLMLSAEQKSGSKNTDLLQYFENQAENITNDFISYICRELFGSFSHRKTKKLFIPREKEEKILQAFDEIPVLYGSTPKGLWSHLAQQPVEEPPRPQQPPLPPPEANEIFDLFFYIDKEIEILKTS